MALSDLQIGAWNVMGGNVLPSTQGNVWHVKPGTGSNDNDGKSPQSAFKTVLYAFNAATANQNDIILLYAEHNTSASTTDYWSAKLTWNKNCTHLIGVGAPTRIGMRARISQLSTVTGIDGLLTVSAHSCIFANILIHQGVADATSEHVLTVSGSRNYFYNVNIQGLLGEAQAQAGGLGQVLLTGAEENTFEKCVFGADTVGQGANATLEVAADSRDNIFDNCIFLTCSSSADYLHVSIADNGLLGFLMFDTCKFLNSPTAAGAVTTMTTCATAAKALTDYDGVVLVWLPFMQGITDFGSGGAYYGLGIGASDSTSTDLGVAESITAT